MSDIEIIECNDDKKGKWNEFVQRSNNGTIFHRLDFLSYHSEGKFDEHNLMFFKGGSKGGKLTAVMPMALFREKGRVVARSPYGASFGGIVVESLLTFEESEQIVASLLDYLGNLGVASLCMAPPPHFYYRSASDYIEFSLIRRGATTVKREITSVIDLTSFESDPFDIYTGKSRTAIRKAEKSNIAVLQSWDTIIDFYNILAENYNRHNRSPTHSLDELIKLKETLPEFFKIEVAYVDGKAIGGALYFICNPRAVLLFYDCRKLEYSAHNPVNFLLHRGVVWAKQQGFRYLDLGTSTANMQPNDSLFKFKESLGASGIFRDTYILELLA